MIFGDGQAGSWDDRDLREGRIDQDMPGTRFQKGVDLTSGSKFQLADIVDFIGHFFGVICLKSTKENRLILLDIFPAHTR